MTHQQKTNLIRKEIRATYDNLKEKYPILRLQNLLGFLIFIMAIVITSVMGYLWWIEIVPAWLLIIVNAFVFGVLHELEHDLLHWMYFRNNKIVHNAMLLVVWMKRPLTINPWIRRQLHYHHHKYSGTVHDVEERGVTNGEKWSIWRFILTADLFVGGLVRVRSMFKDIRNEVNAGRLKIDLGNRLKRNAVVGLIPITVIAHVIVYIFGLNILLDFLNVKFSTGLLFPLWLKSVLVILKPYIYIILLPNVLRQFCLHFITSNIHYFADIEDGNVIEQTQVLNVWWTFPAQLFSFFFGWTHAIHHFVVQETFYNRHFTRKKAHAIMKKYGVRFNDLGTFSRANRFNDLEEV